MPAITPASVPSRIDGDDRHARGRGRRRRTPRRLGRACSARPRSCRHRWPGTRTARPGGACRRAPRASGSASSSAQYGAQACTFSAPGRRGGASSPPPSTTIADHHERDQRDGDGDHAPSRATVVPRRRGGVVGPSRRAPARVGGGVAATNAPRSSGVTSAQRRHDVRARRPDRSATRLGRRRRRSRPPPPTSRRSASPRWRRTAPGRRRARRRPAGTARDAACRWSTASPVMTAWNVIGASASTTASTSRLPRHRDERARHALAVSSVSRRRAPGRHGTRSRTRAMTPSSRRSTISVGSSAHAAPVAQHRGGVEQVEADDRAGVGVGPRAAELGDELVLGTPSSTARCRRACRPCPTGRPPAVPPTGAWRRHT